MFVLLLVVVEGVDDYVSFSLKNYKKGFNRIQLCSGTWHSFLNNFLFKSAGVGTFIDPYSGQVFQGCDYERRDSLVEQLGYSTLTDSYQFFDDVFTLVFRQLLDDTNAFVLLVIFFSIMSIA